MSITQEEAGQIRTEQKFLKEQISSLVQALHDNTDRVGEMLIEMKERDVRDEYREKEFSELKDAIHETNTKIDDYIEKKEPIVEWAKRRKDFYDGLFSSITSTWGKLVAGAIVVGIAYAVGLDLSKFLK